MWARWLRASAGLLRADCLAGRVCGDANRGAALAAVQAACGNASASPNAAAQLFSVYVHPPPAFRGYPVGSIFRGREVPNRVKVKWGGYSIVEARARIKPLGWLTGLRCKQGYRVWPQRSAANRVKAERAGHP